MRTTILKFSFFYKRIKINVESIKTKLEQKLKIFVAPQTAFNDPIEHGV